MNLPVQASFEVIDESADWLVVHKPAPLIVHPANRQTEPTLLGGIECLLAFECANGAKPAIVTRLDRETSGIVLVAKHTRAARELGMAFEHRQVHKEYLAIVHGWPSEDAWENHQPILRAGSLGPSPVWVRQCTHPQGKPCQTAFRVEQRLQTPAGPFSLIRCFPHTGRMHQIRVHLAASGHPIAGDKLYTHDGAEYLEWMEHGWTPGLARRLPLPRHALHATVLTVPWQGSSLTWHAPLAPDLADFLAGRPTPAHPAALLWNRHAPSPAPPGWDFPA